MNGGEINVSFDTNIFLELLLDQEKADEVEQLLQTVPREEIHLTELSLYSIGIILFRRKLFNTFREFVEDIIGRGGICILRLPPQYIETLVEIAQRFNLNFDDAYQYAVAQKYNLTLLSFDSDFDRTEKGRRTPEQISK